MTGIKLSDYAKANNLSEEKIIIYITKGYLNGSLVNDEWQVNPSPLGLLIAKIMDSPFERLKANKGKAIIFAILVLLAVLNPGASRHSTAIVDKFMPKFEQRRSNIFSQIELQLSTQMVMAQMGLDYHNYIVASTMSTNDAVVTLGFCGFVFYLH